jgi:hypothetical protein
MATKITDTEMTSDQTRHRAWVVAYCGWVVSWLPGRFLTYDGAITAMTIAEVVAGIDFTPEFNRSPVGLAMWDQIDSWASELGISGPQAVAEASLSPEEHGTEPEAPEPCGLCQLRAERGIAPPEGGCSCRANPVDYAAVDEQLALLRRLLAVRPGEARVLCELLEGICARLTALEAGERPA